MFITSKSERSAKGVLSMATILKENGPDKIPLKINFLAWYDEVNKSLIRSQRGQDEVVGDIWELCAISHYSPIQYLDFLVCMGQAFQDIPHNNERCVTEAKLDINVMKTCVHRDGISLLEQSMKMSSNKGIHPHHDEDLIFIGGTRYKGARDVVSLRQAICAVPVMDSDDILEKWWFYVVISLSCLAALTLLAMVFFVLYTVYLKCNNASDLWLNMIKSNPGHALDFADQVQSTVQRLHKETHKDEESGYQQSLNANAGKHPQAFFPKFALFS